MADHFGDPCVTCRVPHDEVEPGPCPVGWLDALDRAEREFQETRVKRKHYGGSYEDESQKFSALAGGLDQNARKLIDAALRDRETRKEPKST